MRRGGSIGILLRLLPHVGVCKNIRVRVLVTSRPETPIRHGFDQMETASQQGFVLHPMPTEVSDKDIQVYLQHYLSTIAIERRLKNLLARRTDTGDYGEIRLRTVHSGCYGFQVCPRR